MELHFKKTATLLLLMFFLILFGFGQDSKMNVDETLKYINQKLRENYFARDDKTYYLNYSWQDSLSISKGVLIVNRIFKYTKTQTGDISGILSTYTVKLSEIDENIEERDIENNPGNKVFSLFSMRPNDHKRSDFVNKTSTYFPSSDAPSSSIEPKIDINFSNAREIATNLHKALNHLIQAALVDPNYNNKWDVKDPFDNSIGGVKPMNANENVIKTTKSNVIWMIKKDGVFEIPVLINGVLKLNFILDSGASDVSISPDVASTLIKTGTIQNLDFIGTQKYQFADGGTAISRVFLIRELKIGNKVITNVRASISSSIDAPMLLGQSLLQRIGKFSIDNSNHTLTIE